MTDDSRTIDDVLATRSVRTLFQPVIDLDTGQVAGYEALTRGPDGPLNGPSELLGAARDANRLPELDWLCRTSAIETARSAGVRSPLSLLINAEPETLHADRHDPSRWAEFADLRCYAEITERALARSPGSLVGAIDRIRAQDWGVALDDVGANPESLALLPLLQPDLIKLDLRLLQDTPSEPGDVRVARVVDAALTQAAATGADVIAEGIETEWHLELARAYGVRFGQGLLLGEPAPLPDPLPSPRRSMPLVPRILDRTNDPGPFAVVISAQPVRRLSQRAVFELARQLLAQAGTLVPPPTVLVCADRPLPQELLAMVTALVDGHPEIPLVGLLGAPQPPLPVTALTADDPARHDFSVAVVTPHFAAAMVARTALDDDADFDAALVLNRDLAVAAATALLTRL